MNKGGWKELRTGLERNKYMVGKNCIQGGKEIHTSTLNICVFYLFSFKNLKLIRKFHKCSNSNCSNQKKMINEKGYFLVINPFASPGEVVSVFTSPYLSAGAPALGEAKGLNIKYFFKYY